MLNTDLPEQPAGGSSKKEVMFGKDILTIKIIIWVSSNSNSVVFFLSLL